MQLRSDQLAAHLARGPLKPVYTLHGDEALLAQEAGDAIRFAARAQRPSPALRARLRCSPIAATCP